MSPRLEKLNDIFAIVCSIWDIFVQSDADTFKTKVIFSFPVNLLK